MTDKELLYILAQYFCYVPDYISDKYKRSYLNIHYNEKNCTLMEAKNIQILKKEIQAKLYHKKIKEINKSGY